MKKKNLLDYLKKRKKSFFVRFETNLNLWSERNYDKESDYFDFEDMIISRYWLFFLKEKNLLNSNELEKLEKLEQNLKKKGIINFVKKNYNYLYEKWIKTLEIKRGK